MRGGARRAMRLALVNHFKSTQALTPPKPALAEVGAQALDLKDIKGQGTAKQALEVTAAGGHNLLISWTWRPTPSAGHLWESLVFQPGCGVPAFGPSA